MRTYDGCTVIGQDVRPWAISASLGPFRIDLLPLGVSDQVNLVWFKNMTDNIPSTELQHAEHQCG